jgi:hypothetical protein
MIIYLSFIYIRFSLLFPSVEKALWWVSDQKQTLGFMFRIRSSLHFSGPDVNSASLESVRLCSLRTNQGV